MGIERDFLMRQLMMLFDAIQRILRLRKRGDYDEALNEVRNFYSYLKIDEGTEQMDIEELLYFLVEKKKLSNEHLEMIASVIKEQGEMAETETLRLGYFRKAYFLLDKVDRESTSFSFGRQMQLAELRSNLNPEP